jgi:hypothetical protein
MTLSQARNGLSARTLVSGTIRAGSVAVLLVGMACVGSNQAAQTPGPPAGASDGGVADADVQVERPFAHSAVEAQGIIQELIDGRMKTLWKCVDAYRTARGDPHKAVIVDVGIDQEGHLLGVTTPNTKQDLDPTLKQCLWDGLHNLPFPRSHAGVITVRQSFTDATVTQ